MAVGDQRFNHEVALNKDSVAELKEIRAFLTGMKSAGCSIGMPDLRELDYLVDNIKPTKTN